MPSLSKENYPYNAKIKEFLCDFCETSASAHNKNENFVHVSADTMLIYFEKKLQNVKVM
jgi:hypothetical protein